MDRCPRLAAPPRWLRLGPALLALWCISARAQPADTPTMPERPPAATQPSAPAAPAPTPAPPALVPPRLIESPPPRFPSQHLGGGQQPSVVLHVTLDDTGQIRAVHVDHSAGEDFDTAALEAVQHWRFTPAYRGDEPIPASVHVAVHFRLPQFDLPMQGPGEVLSEATVHPERPYDAPLTPDASRRDVPASSAQGSPALEGPTDPDLTFRASASIEAHDAQPEPRAASQYRIGREILEAAPHRDVGDMLRSAPGVFIARAEGDAVAHRITLRGFDAEHGQDIEISASGVPINQPSHIHGQGYADLGFLIPEVVREIQVTEGVYDPRQGDFAIAGSIDFDLGVERRGLQARSSYGSFNTFRQLLVWAPERESVDTFGAVSYRSTDGFGMNRGGASGSAIAQYAFGIGDWKGRLHAAFYGARYNLGGVVRRDDIDAERVAFHDSYPASTANAQSALATRAQLAGSLERRDSDGAISHMGVWLAFNDTRSLHNFTGFLQRSRHDPDWRGRGDLIEQRNETLSLGMRASHRGARLELAPWANGFFELGTSSRVDLIGQAQNLVQAPQNETWDRRVDSEIRAADVGGWLDADWHLGDRVHLRGGFRADLLYYNIDDRLGNFIPRFRRDDYIVGHRRSALGMATGPRSSISVGVLPWLTALAAYGEGFRSPQARLLDEGETAPFAKVRSADAGVRMAWGADEALSITLSGYLTTLSQDVAFDAAEGRLEPLGPTTRKGGVLYAVAKPVPWWTSALSVTYVHATLDEPPAPTAEQPSPPYQSGQRLPYVPPWVLRLDNALRPHLGTWNASALRGRLGVGSSYLSARPLPFGQHAEPIFLLDASMGLEWRFLELTVEGFNLLDARWAATEYSFVSNWEPGAVPSRLPARHVAAGAPLTLLVTLGVTL